jgi:hypothetical protein
MASLLTHMSLRGGLDPPSPRNLLQNQYRGFRVKRGMTVFRGSHKYNQAATENLHRYCGGVFVLGIPPNELNNPANRNLPNG